MCSAYLMDQSCRDRTMTEMTSKFNGTPIPVHTILLMTKTRGIPRAGILTVSVLLELRVSFIFVKCYCCCWSSAVQVVYWSRSRTSAHNSFAASADSAHGPNNSLHWNKTKIIVRATWLKEICRAVVVPNSSVS